MAYLLILENAILTGFILSLRREKGCLDTFIVVSFLNDERKGI